MCKADEQIQKQKKMQEQVHAPEKTYLVQPYENPIQSVADRLAGTDMRNAHQKSYRIGNIWKTVRKYMPGVYKHMEDVHAAPQEAQRLSVLHDHTREQEMGEELVFNIAGSGFSQFREEYMGLKGKYTYKINGKDVKFSEKEIVTGKHKTASLINRYFSWLPKVKTPGEIEDYNTKLDLAKSAIETEYGKSQVVDGKFLANVREKTTEENGRQTTEINMAGPLNLFGASNSGDYSIPNLRKYIKEMGSNYLKSTFHNWDRLKGTEGFQGPHNIPIVIKGHSRGAVAAAEGAMMLKEWVHESHPEYEKYVKFVLTQYDPVPGMGSTFGANQKVDVSGDGVVEKGGDKMRALGDSAETTVFYSLHTEHEILQFTPQAVMGAKRVILMASKHSVGLDKVDQSKVKKEGEAKAHVESAEATYTDIQSGDAYRGSGINDLGEGVYIVDEKNQLVQLRSRADAQQMLTEVLDSTLIQGGRHEVINQVLDAWFGAHKWEQTHPAGTRPQGTVRMGENRATEDHS